MSREIKRSLRKKARERTAPEEESKEKDEKIRRATARLLDAGEAESKAAEDYSEFSKISPPQEPLAVDNYAQYERYRSSIESYEEEKARIEEARQQASDSYFEAQDELAKLCPPWIYYRVCIRDKDFGVWVLPAKDGNDPGTVLLTPWSEVEKQKTAQIANQQGSQHSD